MEYMEQQMRQHIEAGIGAAEQCYARIAELEEQNAALAAHVEALRSQLKIAYDCLTCADETGYVEDCGFVDLEAVASDIAIAISTTPQHHLRQLQADAGRDGFIAGYMLCNDGAPLLKHNYKGMADNYHASILAGKE